MKIFLVVTLLFISSLLYGQTADTHLQRILSDVLQDSSLNTDIAKINGLPVKAVYRFRNEPAAELDLDGRFLNKQYVITGPGMPQIQVESYQLSPKKYSSTAKLSILLPDGTHLSFTAKRLSPNLRWYPAYYRLKGNNQKTGERVGIARGEI